MRLIKFRAWDTKRKKMWSAEEMAKDQLTLMPDGTGFINVSGASTRLSQVLPHLIPLQFTDHYAKGGKEICEKDIVKTKYEDLLGIEREVIGVVEKGNLQWELIFPAYGVSVPMKCFFTEYEVDGSDFEIMGTEFENPELIEEQPDG